MNLRICILFSCLCFGLASCSFIPNELKTAERLMESKPDSALSILQHINPHNIQFDSNRALYGLLLFQALDKNAKPLQPDSLLNFSITYYLKQNDLLHLATCYYYKGRKYKLAHRYDEATLLYLKALDCIGGKKEYVLLGKIYADMGDICSVQMDYKESLKKYQLSFNYFKRAGKPIDASYIILNIGRTFRFEKQYNAAHKYYLQAIADTKDSMLLGVALQEIGINYYWSKQNDSAQYYLRKSLHFPYKGTNYSIRNFTLADLFFDIAQYDSAYKYATIALKHPANFYTQRDCYRILVNIEYLRKDIKQMGKYMTQYQHCGDSISKVESQTKSTVLENLHNTALEANGTRQNMLLIVSVLLIGLILSALFVNLLFKRNKNKKEQLELFRLQLNSKQQFVNQSLSTKIEETKALQAEARKSASPKAREMIDKELYENSLHLTNWSLFKQEMNPAFNQIVDKLEVRYPTITRKEITWCCFQLLDIPTSDRMLLLDATADSLYKLKQRLAHKMNLQSTKELDQVLKELTAL